MRGKEGRGKGEHFVCLLRPCARGKPHAYFTLFLRPRYAYVAV